MDTNKTVFRSAASFFSGTMFSRLSGLLRDMAMAYAFGTKPELAAFMIAFRFAHFFRRFFGEGCLQSAFIPQFEAVRHQDPHRAALLFRDVCWGLASFLTVLVVGLLAVLGASLYLVNWKPENAEIIQLTMWMLPSLIFICLYGLNTALLECEKSFFIPSVAPVMFNIVWASITIFLIQIPIEQAVVILSIAVILACAAQWLATLPLTLKYYKKLGPESFKPSNFFTVDVKAFVMPLLLANIGIAASQLNSALDPLFARYANAEGPAWLWYAIRMQQLPMGLFAVSLSGALLPPLARAAKRGDWRVYDQLLKAAVHKMLWIMIPATALCYFFGSAGIELFFGRGDFGPESIAATNQCLWGYAIGLIPMSCILLYAPALYAYNDYKTPSISSGISVTLSLFLNWLFIMVWEWGAASVALSTSIAAWVNCLQLSWAIHRKQKARLALEAAVDIASA